MFKVAIKYGKREKNEKDENVVKEVVSVLLRK